MQATNRVRPIPAQTGWREDKIGRLPALKGLGEGLCRTIGGTRHGCRAVDSAKVQRDQSSECTLGLRRNRIDPNCRQAQRQRIDKRSEWLNQIVCQSESVRPIGVVNTD